jgi:hypothetical protein
MKNQSRQIPQMAYLTAISHGFAGFFHKRQVQCTKGPAKGGTIMYKTLVIDAMRKTKKMAAAIEKTANKMAEKGWDLVTFSFTKSGKAVLLFYMDDYYFTDDELEDDGFCEDGFCEDEFCGGEFDDDEPCECDEDADEIETEDEIEAEDEAQAEELAATEEELEAAEEIAEEDAFASEIKAAEAEAESAASGSSETGEAEKEETREESGCGDAEPAGTEQEDAGTVGEAR